MGGGEILHIKLSKAAQTVLDMPLFPDLARHYERAAIPAIDSTDANAKLVIQPDMKMKYTE